MCNGKINNMNVNINDNWHHPFSLHLSISLLGWVYIMMESLALRPLCCDKI